MTRLRDIMTNVMDSTIVVTKLELQLYFRTIPLEKDMDLLVTIS